MVSDGRVRWGVEGGQLAWRKERDGKPEMSLLPAEALFETAYVFAYGARKYSRDNWRRAPSHVPYIDAALRHLYRHIEGFPTPLPRDEESGLPHLAHAAACILIALALEKARSERVRPGGGGDEVRGDATHESISIADKKRLST